MRPGKLRSALAALCFVGACVTNDPKPPPTDTPATVTSFAELKAADGQVVRVTGKVQHEKLGDSVVVEEGLDVLCPDLRLPDGVTEATVEGRLELWEPPVAEVNETGEISQGVEEGTSRWVLRDCKHI
jgi:hypothetical protein